VEALVTANTEENISTPESISIPHLKVSSNQIRTGVANENLFPVRVADNETKLTETEVNSRKKKTIFTILYIAITILIVAAVSVIGNFRLIHPMSGDKNSLGKISNSLVLVTKTSSFQPGDMVTANISSKKWSPTYGVIEAINGKNILLTNQIGSFEINKDALSGKAIVVIPFLGLLARF
jgi:nitrate reductase NapE component